MTVGQVIVVVSLLANTVGINPAVPVCISYYESGHQVTAVNGRHVSNVQWDPDTFYWLAEKAVGDPSFVYSNYVRDHYTPEDPLAAMMVFVWALRNGYAEHWSTYPLCSDIQPIVVCPQKGEKWQTRSDTMYEWPYPQAFSWIR